MKIEITTQEAKQVPGLGDGIAPGVHLHPAEFAGQITLFRPRKSRYIQISGSEDALQNYIPPRLLAEACQRAGIEPPKFLKTEGLWCPPNESEREAEREARAIRAARDPDFLATESQNVVTAH